MEPLDGEHRGFARGGRPATVEVRLGCPSGDKGRSNSKSARARGGRANGVAVLLYTGPCDLSTASCDAPEQRKSSGIPIPTDTWRTEDGINRPGPEHRWPLLRIFGAPGVCVCALSSAVRHSETWGGQERWGLGAGRDFVLPHCSCRRNRYYCPHPGWPKSARPALDQ